MGCCKLTYHEDLPGMFPFHRKNASSEPLAQQNSRVKRNHLGNVLSIISDKVIPHAYGSTVDYYLADNLTRKERFGIRQSSDYSPFGVQLSGRNFVKSGAKEGRFGYQGSEEDDELKGEGNSVNYTFRMHDPRLGRFFAIDPLAKDFPWNSPYAFSENRVMDAVELEGLECWLISSSPVFMSQRPVVSPLTEAMVKTSVETAQKTPVTRTPNFEAIARGVMKESEILNRLGIPKNTEKISSTEGNSIQEGITQGENGGLTTLEVKFVRYQALTRQLRIQRDWAFRNGENPILWINKESSTLSKNLLNSGFEINYYGIGGVSLLPNLTNSISSQTPKPVLKEWTVDDKIEMRTKILNTHRETLAKMRKSPKDYSIDQFKHMYAIIKQDYSRLKILYQQKNEQSK